MVLARLRRGSGIPGRSGFTGGSLIGPVSSGSTNERIAFVLATGRTETVRDFVRMAFAAAGYQLEWSGKEERETGIDVATGKTLVRVNPKFYRPAEVDLLIGCADKAREKLGWKPETTLEQLCHMMVHADLGRNEHHETF